MARIPLEAGDDHVERLAHEKDPLRAVLELIWNGLDADADRVTVTLERNEGGGVSGVVVTDDGDGISPESVESSFRWIGNSWKRTTRRTIRKSRPIHGRFGQGRIRAWALGTTIEWATVAVSTDGTRYLTKVRGDVSDRNHLEASHPIVTKEATGTTFRAVGREGVDRLVTEQASEFLAMALAPHLMANEEIVVVYDGDRVDPSQNICADTGYQQLTWTHGSEHFDAQIRIIEWIKAERSALHFCDPEGVAVDDAEAPSITNFRYSAYVLWDQMPKHSGEWMIAKLEPEGSVVGGLLIAVEEFIDSHFEQRRAEKRRDVVRTWVDNKTYPYGGEPTTEEETVERAAFDVVATSIQRHIPKSRKQQKLALGLLRESLQQRPDDVGELLDQFLGLAPEERAELDRLLKRTSLSRLISATANVTNRLEFLRALELMVFDPETNNLVKEREHLHKILESELWIFGEEYNQMLSERGLTAALDRHLEVLGEGRSDKSVVRRLDGTLGRLDLLLSAAATEFDRNRHLVVELKSPGLVVDGKETDQIESYAAAVAADPRFADTSTQWDFWLVTGDMSERVKQKANQKDRPRGLLFEPDIPNAPAVRVRVWVRTWAEIIEDIRRRLAYFQDQLQHDPSFEEARDYLRRNHANVIPEGLLTEGARTRFRRTGS